MLADCDLVDFVLIVCNSCYKDDNSDQQCTFHPYFTFQQDATPGCVQLIT